MNLILAFIQLIFIIIILLYEYKNGSSVIFLWATLLIIFGLPHFMSVITGLLIFPEYVYIKASFFVILFNLIYLFTRFIFIRIFNAENTFESLKFDLENKTILFKEKKEPGRLLFLLCFFFLISIVFFTKEYGSLLHTSWGQLYGNSMSAYSLGFNLESIRYFTKYILFATGGLFLLYFYQKQMLKSMIVAGIIIMLSIITRDRITILPIIIPFILIFLMKNPKINFKKVLQLTIVGFIVIYIIYALRLFRHYGEITNFINTFDFFEFNNKLFNMLLNDDGELGLRNVFLNFIDNNNDFMNFNQGHTYIRLLLIAIPTSFSFGFKPPDFAISMGSAELGNTYNTTFSTHPTLYGDVFANLYWFGILLAIFWALYATVVDKLLNRKSLVLKSNLIVIFSCVYVIIGRGSVYNGVYFALVSSIILLVLYIIFHIIPIIRLKKSTVKNNYNGVS